MEKYKKTKLRVENILTEIQNWKNRIFWVNIQQYKQLKIYENQYFMKDNWVIWILEIKKQIKIIPKIKYIREYASDTKKVTCAFFA